MTRSRWLDGHAELGIRSEDETGAVNAGSGDDRVLRAKYLDWCSARIAERFLQLTPDEIYELAQGASGEGLSNSHGASFASGLGAEAGRAGWSDLEPIESFRRIVERVTEVLAARAPLPSFDEWSAQYRRTPGRYDEELLGFWKEML